jgi:hypothetical protein
MLRSCLPMSTGTTALLGALRRTGDEVQLTQALSAVFQAEPRAAGAFVRLLLPADREGLPEVVSCRHEESFEEGRIDLRFTADEVDVIVEIKIHAGYGRDQLERYLRALRPVRLARLVAITRDVPRYGESHISDAEWIGSVRWRDLRKELRILPFDSESLRVQWLAFLDLLESEGSMGFTRPDPALFDAWHSIRLAAKHADEFLRAIRVPLLQALRDVLGGGDATADFYRAQRGKGQPVISKSWNGIIDIPFRVPADGHLGVRAGVFAFNPPTRFYVSPHHGRRLSARRARLSDAGRAGLDRLLAGEFREYDLHAFLPLDAALLTSPTFEEDVVGWAHARFSELAASGLLSEQHQIGVPTSGELPPEDEDDEFVA